MLLPQRNAMWAPETCEQTHWFVLGFLKDDSEDDISIQVVRPTRSKASTPINVYPRGAVRELVSGRADRKKMPRE